MLTVVTQYVVITSVKLASSSDAMHFIRGIGGYVEDRSKTKKAKKATVT